MHNYLKIYNKGSVLKLQNASQPLTFADFQDAMRAFFGGGANKTTGTIPTFKSDALQQQFTERLNSGDSIRDARNVLLGNYNPKDGKFKNDPNAEAFYKELESSKRTDQWSGSNGEGMQLGKMGKFASKLGIPGIGENGNIGFGTIANVGGMAIDQMDSALLGDKNFDARSQAVDTLVNGASDMLMKSGTPWGVGSAIALKGLNFISKAGGQTVQGFDVGGIGSGYDSNMGHMESKSNRAWGSFLPGIGGLTQLATNKKIQKQLTERNEQAQMALMASNITASQREEQDAKSHSVDDTIQANNIALAGGTDTSLLAAKNGAVLRAKNVVKLSKAAGKTVIDENGNTVKVPRNIDEDQKAGRKPFYYKGKAYYLSGDSKTCGSKEFVEKRNQITSAKNGAKLKKIELSEGGNILPDGSLHKNKHDIDLEHITKKGIPVITVDDDSVQTFEDIKSQEKSIQQHAEIESLEIIFNKEVTDFIEDNRKKWHEGNEKDDDLLTEVGKRITKEILFNTKDEDKLIKKLKEKENGGDIQQIKS